jgi:hypothetical protein
MSKLLFVLLIVFPYFISSVDQRINDEKEAQLYLKDFDKKLGEKISSLTFIQWDFNTDMTDENEKKVVSILNEISIYPYYYYYYYWINRRFRSVFVFLDRRDG